jgi:hypothetical protein
MTWNVRGLDETKMKAIDLFITAHEKPHKIDVVVLKETKTTQTSSFDYLGALGHGSEARPRIRQSSDKWGKTSAR